jgi:hypothetical protein
MNTLQTKSRACNRGETRGKTTRGAAALLVRFKLDDRNPECPELCAAGRDAWALMRLVHAGQVGITALDNPAPRLSHYIFKLRRMGVNISTEYEAHGGAYSGEHGRYRLLSPIRIVQVVEAGAPS